LFSSVITLAYLPDLYCLLCYTKKMTTQKPFILIADDDQEDRYLIHTAFEEIGRSNDIFLVENGVQVFSYLDASLHQHTMPSLIVLDLNMPLLDGMETLSRLKAHNVYRDIPVIIYTTSIQELEKEKCLQIGAADFIKKPAHFQQTVSTAKFFHDSATGSRVSTGNHSASQYQ
jgi:CheY-like chemotaxis protein